MHTINQNFLFTLYNICFRNGPGLISALGITSSDNTPADSYWTTNFKSESWSTESFSGLTLATGSYSTNANWYTLNGPVVTSSLILGTPTVIYRSASAAYLTSSIGIRRQFTVT